MRYLRDKVAQLVRSRMSQVQLIVVRLAKVGPIADYKLSFQLPVMLDISAQ